MGHQTLKTSHDSDTGVPNRIKYDGESVYVGFDIETTASDGGGAERTAVLDCVGTYEIHDGDEMAYVDLEELSKACKVVGRVPYIDRVATAINVTND
jgi:hypothetical protein